MKLLKGSFKNFGSYADLEFDFSSPGLALAFGRTGSGKSTLPDMAAWTLFGVTAKDGSVDDVRSWVAPGEPTIGKLEVDVNGTKIQVTRIRGKASTNDLYWTDGSPGDAIRGKDLNDTQRLLEGRLGVSADLYLTGAYFHEFSSTGLFFTAKAKDRRAVFEKIANMDLALRLSISSSEARKVARKLLLDAQTRESNYSGRRDQMVHSLRDSRERSGEFEATVSARIAEYQAKSESFEKTKAEKIKALELKYDVWEKESNQKIDALVAKIEAIDKKIKPIGNLGIRDLEEDLEEAQKSKCPRCGGPDAADKVRELYGMISALKDKKATFDKLVSDRYGLASDLEVASSKENPYSSLLSAADAEVNTYLDRIAEEKKKPNPFKAQAEKIEKELKEVTEEHSRLESEINLLEAKVSNLTALYDLSFELRGELLQQAVQNAQDSTNRYLEKYFDSEIRVGFALEGSDDLTVSIQKSGYDCAYKQLSKGQRSLLRLSFVVSIMKAAANKAGIHFDNLFFDEALDGLDSDLKIKAFSMLEELSQEHESILVIDHAPEFQNLFTKRFHVTMESDLSSIEELNE